MAHVYLSSSRSDCDRDSGYGSDGASYDIALRSATPPSWFLEPLSPTAFVAAVKLIDCTATRQAVDTAHDALQLLEYAPTYTNTCPTLLKHLHSTISMAEKHRPSCARALDRSKTHRGEGHPHGSKGTKGRKPQDFYKGITRTEAQKLRRSGATPEAAAGTRQRLAEQHDSWRYATEQHESEQTESPQQKLGQQQSEEPGIEQVGDEQVAIGRGGLERHVSIPAALHTGDAPTADAFIESIRTLPENAVPDLIQRIQEDPKQDVSAIANLWHDAITLSQPPLLSDASSPLLPVEQNSIPSLQFDMSDEGYESLPIHSPSDLSRPLDGMTVTKDIAVGFFEGDSASSPVTPNKTYSIRNPMVAPPQVPYELPYHKGTACVSCNSWTHDNGSDDLCIACPVCNSFVCFLDEPGLLQPALILDLLSQVRTLPLDGFAKQSIIVDGREATELLATVYAVVAHECGGDEGLGTAHMSPRKLLRQLEEYFNARRYQDLTTPEQLKMSMEGCIEDAVFDELLRRSENKWLKKQATRLRHKRLTKLVPELARNERGLEYILPTWRVIIGWVVGIMTLRWEQRF
ncbi:hypothetical protein BU25DRAFT_425142 [Macroventuria anomochaeta]|uniref:Uncharacterized protein n=1 Tax=Macroventuria anomochaeta TaxID=301207 RepID=A0ACB6RMM6_9PLEO|nr:uncharacterized protein BU25DRAFT_425142 [Macroventuria anomochaeta]KAF2623131.1 hypothetical protein BU25DRAFT_425142 [Macroventuria anomochaeta]